MNKTKQRYYNSLLYYSFALEVRARNSLSKYLRSIFPYVVLLLTIMCFSFSYVYAFQISDVFIEAQGNNQFEAKLRAQRLGTMRAFLLYANKLGIASSELSDAVNLNLEAAIEQVVYQNEKSLDNQYRAMATYNINRSVATGILYDLISPEQRNNFYECLILPVMKVGKTYHIWDNSIKWLKAWENSKGLLTENKILLFTSQDSYRDLIIPQNIDSLSYNNFEEIHPELPIKKFYLIIAEFYTNLDSGSSYLQVEYRYIGSKKVSSIVRKYNLPSNAQLEMTLNNIINQFASEFGSKKEISSKNSFERIIENEKKKILKGKLQSITLNVEAFDIAQWDRIKLKLDRVTEIERIIIKEQIDQDYILELKYNTNLEKLTQALLNVGLSYNLVKNKYYLIETNDGI
jgi:hypothetical protein